MPVARTYENCPVVRERYNKDKKWYVDVQTKNGIKTVRWYSEAERARMDKATGIVEKKDVMDFNARQAFGFGEKGYITLYKGKNVEEWANCDRTNIWFNLTFLFYTPSKFESPEVLTGITPVRLNWSDVVDHDNKMKPHEEVQKIVTALLEDESASKFQGNVNDWLQKTVTVREKKTNETHFGTKHTFTLEDAEGNSYIWETGAKDYACSQTVSLKMKVKEHKEIKGTKITVVWYCKEI